MRNILNLSEVDFALPNEAFVLRCLQLAELTDSQVDAVNYRQFIEMLRSGIRTRLEIANAIAHYSMPSELSKIDAGMAYNFISQPMDHYIVADVLLNFAPEDDQAFLAFAARKILGREPLPNELLVLEFDLRRGILTRMESIEWLVNLSRALGRMVVCEGMDQVNIPKQGIGFTINSKGVMQFVSVRATGMDNWEVAPGCLAQCIVGHNGGWKIHPGWVISGPKITFEAGNWLLELDFVQPQTARVVIDVIANSALDILFCQEFTGSATVGIKLNIQSSHKFLELRILKPEQDENLCWIAPRRIALARME